MARMKIALLLPVALALSCGDDGQNLCPHGCDVGGSTVVKYTLNAYPDLGFQSDSCSDFGLGLKVHVSVVKTDDATVLDAQDVDCSGGQATFSALDPGTYNVEVTVQDSGGNQLLKAPATAMVPAAVENGRSEVTVNVTYDLWTQAYAGTFLFQLAWGGQKCADAIPPVATQLLTLSRMGTPLAVMSHDAMQAMDGSDPKPCESMFDYVENLPFGPISLAIIGKDVGGAVRYQKQFDTFVGVGTFNPTITYDLPLPDAPPPPDAPIDATPDGP
jgi:hypothetical protein